MVMKWLASILFSVSCWGQTCIPFNDDARYCRVFVDPADTFWWLHDSPAQTQLYLNGTLQSQEGGGNATIDYVQLEPRKQITVGIIDSGAHGVAVAGIVSRTCGSPIIISDYGVTGVTSGIKTLLSSNCGVINLSWFSAAQGDTLNDLSNACSEAWQAGVILVCSVPDSAYSIDNPVTPAYPAGWNLPNIIAVTASTRQDYLYGAAAWGQRVIAAPGRIIVTDSIDGGLCYCTGTSYAAPIVTGIVVSLLGQGYTWQQVIAAINSTAVPIDSRIRGRISMTGALDWLTRHYAVKARMNVEQQ